MSRKKIYYPKGQVQNGLYTQGKEWMLEDGTEYIGDYHKYTTGEVFTIATYIRNKSQKLIPYINLSVDANRRKFEYDNLLKSEFEDFVFASYEKTQPTPDDYNRGSFTRYFVKRRFNDIITEVSRDTFNSVQDEHYTKVELAWKLTGETFVSNQKQILTAEKDIKGISNYITNYSEYRVDLTQF